MEQVLLKKGIIYTAKVERPRCEKDMVLVKTEYSCISAGTEMSGVTSSGKNVIERMIDSPALIERGLKMLKEKGFKSTLDAVQGKLDIGTAMGYTASGVVIESGTAEFQPGDRVACMGVGYANHAGYIVAPKNLTVRIPDSVSFEEASTAALGCIAMQGIRQAEVKLGEYVVIVGMGILGQLASRMAVASGATVIATDLDNRRLQIAKNHGVNYVLDASEDCVKMVTDITGGYGADTVIITAATSSDEVISQSFQMCRKKGKVVLVGVAGMNLKREDMYKKELSFLISTSYGPGRYDTSYEENGTDYPYGYVRFTEKRNLESYLRLIREGKLSIDDVIEKVYPAKDADQAYEALKATVNRPLVVLLKYSEEVRKSKSKKCQESVQYKKPDKKVINIALCGAGGFAKGMHLPNIEKMTDKYRLYAVLSRTGSNALGIAKRYKASYSTTDYRKILDDPEVDMVMICTRHNLHADMAIRAMKAGKAVFVEKPMALTQEETERVIKTAEETGVPFMVGFNRRFSKYAVEAKKFTDLRRNPLIINYRMNAGFIPKDSWIQTEEGGGRIIGEGCHIIDLFGYFTGSRVSQIFTNRISTNTDQVTPEDNCVISLKYEDGSVCTLTYTGQGHKSYGKEFCEIFFDGKTIVIDDYKSIKGYGVSLGEIQSQNSEKGQYEELIAFYDAIMNDNVYTIPLREMEQTTIASIIAQDNQ